MALPEVCRELASSERYLVTIHVGPDGDALSSMISMVRLIRKMGKVAIPVSNDPVPKRYHFFNGWEEVKLPSEIENPESYDGIVILDVGARERVGDVSSLIHSDMRIVNIDHHFSNNGFGDAAWINADACATAEMMTDIYDYLKIDIDSDTANLLYVGIMADTGRFRHSNSNAKTFETAALLIKNGANPSKMANEAYGKTEEKVFRTLGKVLSRIKLYEKGRIATSYLTVEEGEVDSEGFVNHLNSINTVEIGVFMRPFGDGEYKCSFRSSSKANVAAVANSFGGGGHTKAAGARIPGPIESVEKLVVEACKDALSDSDQAIVS